MTIYLSYNYSETLHFAATELCHHLSSCCSGIQFVHDHTFRQPDYPHFQILFKIEDNLSTNSKTDDSYHVSINTSGGFISASNERSVLLAVYALLRKLGFRFLLPGKTVAPSHLTFEDLFMDFSHHASLRHRGVCIEGADSLENVLDFIDWLPKLGFNSFFLQFHEPYIFLERWYHHTFNPFATHTQYNQPEKLTDEFLQSCYRQMNDAMKKRSLLCHAVGHGWTCEAVGLPSVGWITETTAPSPEQARMLACINGKRTYIDSIPMNTNLCYSDPEAFEHFCKCVVDYIETHPDVDYLHIWLADEPNHICECEECRKTTLTDQYICILNEIDRRLTAKKLDCKLVFLLYQELLYPPSKEQLINPERFTLMFAPISRTFKQSYPDTITDVPLPVYVRNHMTLPVTIEENLTYLHKWQNTLSPKHGKSTDSLVYDYPLGRAHYGDFGYVSISRILAGDIKNIKKLNLNGYISCQELRAFLPNGLPNYVMGYLLLDENETFEQLMQEYFSAAYGSCWQEAVTYLSKVSELSDCDYINRIGARTNHGLCRQYTELLSYTKTFSVHIKELLASEPDAFFWKLLDYHSEYVMLLTEALIPLTCGDTVSANEKYSSFYRFVCENEPYMQPYLDVYRIIDVTTKYTGFTLPDIYTPKC